MTGLPRRLLLALLAVECAGIVWLVLNPSPATPTASVGTVSAVLAAMELPAWMADPERVEFALNVVLFVPLAALSALLWPQVRWWQWLLGAFLLSSTLEWVQLQFLTDRTSTSADIIANTLGSWLGVAAVLGPRFVRDAAIERRA